MKQKYTNKQINLYLVTRKIKECQIQPQKFGSTIESYYIYVLVVTDFFACNYDLRYYKCIVYTVMKG